MIANNLKTVRNTLPQGVKLIAVSKKKGKKDILTAYEQGQLDFGENYVQELTEKHESLPKDIQWHFLGHLQSNKVKYIAPFVHLIHGVDSFKLLKEINKQAKKCKRTIPVLLQVFIAKEESKFGFSEQEISEILEHKDFAELKNISVRGFMGMATNSKDRDLIKKEFTELKDLYHKLRNHPSFASHNVSELSMGMTQDFEIAIDCGSTMVRIGSAIFGARP